jgi:hypothetical protein
MPSYVRMLSGGIPYSGAGALTRSGALVIRRPHELRYPECRNHLMYRNASNAGDGETGGLSTLRWWGG